ncbi:MAG TPA: undecaprenyldiphospho-muramoylpentapeptide beta-N-acetylglucosaminyltransferase [Methylophilaceae bacterium]
MTPTLMIMAGGTGGHVFPAIAVADMLKAKGWQIVWLATAGGMENQLIANKNYQVSTITMRGVRGKGLLRWLQLPVGLFTACMQSLKALRKHHPDVVLGMGGFAAFPGGLMAWLMRTPLVIHEQNSVAGLTNRIMAVFARTILAAFPAAFGKRSLVVGNPVRLEIAAIAAPEKRLSGRSGNLRILVIGGSLGAQVLNETVPLALAMIAVEQRPLVKHQAGTKHLQVLQQHYASAGVEAETCAFIEDMAAMYQWSDLVICRAGALTVSELAAAGAASVLVPLPNAVDDHQTGNAHYLADANAALLLPQSELSAQKLANIINNFTRSQLLEMACNARRLAKPAATADVAKICEELAHAT